MQQFCVTVLKRLILKPKFMLDIPLESLYSYIIRFSHYYSVCKLFIKIDVVRKQNGRFAKAISVD